MSGTDRYFDQRGGFAYSQSAVPLVTFYRFGDPRETAYAALPFSVNEVATGEGAGLGIVPDRRVIARTVHTFDDQTGRTALMSVQATKQLGQAAGQWSVQLKGDATPFDVTHDPLLKGKAWADILTDGDWCEIKATINGKVYLLMVGRIDRISVNMSAGDSGVTVTTSVSGRDAGAVYEDVPIYFNPYDPNHANPAGIKVAEMFGADGVLEGSPGQVASQILAAFAGNGPYGQQPEVPAGLFGFTSKNFVDVVADNVQETRGNVFAASALTMTGAGSIWDYANGFVIPQFNEMIVDTRPSEVTPDKSVYLTIRERPFCNLDDRESSPWFNLQPVPVALSELQSISVSKGQNRVNHIQVTTQLLSGMGADATALFPPVYNIRDAKRFGLRRMEQRTQHNFGISGTSDTATPEKLRNLITHWNILNPYYLNGLLTIARLRPDIRVGTKLVMTGGPSPIHPVIPDPGNVDLRTKNCDTALTFYVEAVQWNFQGGDQPRSQTQVMVSRGYPEHKRLSDMGLLVFGWTDPYGVPPSGSLSSAGVTDIYTTDDIVDEVIP